MLREVFQVNKKNFPLIFQKEFRNINEHFDEQFDAANYRLGDFNIISAATPEEIKHEILTTRHLRTLDIEHMIYYSYNRKEEQIQYSLNALESELQQLIERIKSQNGNIVADKRF